MTNYLIDTHAFLWAIDGDKRLPKRFSDILKSDAAIYISVASLWEIAIKASLGKLEVPEDFMSGLGPAGYRILDIRPADIAAVRWIPFHHGDPFDRMLIAQAQVSGLIVLSTDHRFKAYDIELA